MTWLQSLRGESRASVEDPAVPLTSPALYDLFSGGSRSSAGVYVNETSAHRLTAVYRAWSLLAGTIGSLPLQAYSGAPPGGTVWTGDGASLLAYPGGRDETTGIAVPGSPSAMVFFETLIVHLLSWGNAYIVKVPNVARTRVVSLDLLLPSQVQPRWVRKTPDNPAGKEFVVTTQPVGVQDDLGTMRDKLALATPADVIHVRSLGSSLLAGISPIGAARQALGMAVAAEEYGARFFGSGALMAGVLQTDREFTQQKADVMKARWMSKIAGLSHAHEPVVLDNGLKWQQIGIPPGDSQFIESRKFQVTEIARLYGIPPHMLGDVEKSTSWGTGIEQQGLAFIAYTLRPILTRIEQALSNELLPRGVNCRFNPNDLLRGDIAGRFAAYTTAIQNGFMTINEVRLAEGMDPIPGGDSSMFPANFGSLSNVQNPPKATAPATIGGQDAGIGNPQQ